MDYMSKYRVVIYMQSKGTFGVDFKIRKLHLLKVGFDIVISPKFIATLVVAYMI